MASMAKMDRKLRKMYSIACDDPEIGEALGDSHPSPVSEEPIEEEHDMEYMPLTEEHVPDITDITYECFVQREPMDVALQTTLEGFQSWFPRFVKHLLSQKVSIIAQDTATGRCIGCVLNELDFPGKNEGLLSAVKWCENKKFNIIFKVFEKLEEDLDMFEKYSVDKIFRIQMLSVSEKYGGRGIGRKLLSESLKMAKQQGCSVVVTEATGKYSQKAFERLGFVTLREITYGNFTLNGEYPFDTSKMGIHTACKLMVKIIK